MKFASDILMHFLDRAHKDEPDHQFEIFKRILVDGFRFSAVDFCLGSTPGVYQHKVSVPVVCFTDIPLSLTQAHVDRYGGFGIGVRKRTVKRWGGNPVGYLVDGAACGPDDGRGQFASFIRDRINDVIAARDSAASPEVKAMLEKWSWMFTMFKEMADMGEAADTELSDSQDRYYFEREWRVLRGFRHHGSGVDPHNGLPYTRFTFCRTDTRPDGGEATYLKVKPSEIALITVPTRGIRAEVMRWFAGAEGARFLASDSAGVPIPPVVVYEDAREF